MEIWEIPDSVPPLELKGFFEDTNGEARILRFRLVNSIQALNRRWAAEYQEDLTQRQSAPFPPDG